MKAKILLIPITISLLNINLFSSFENEKIDASTDTPIYQTSLTTTINLKKNSEEEIRNYYSSLSSLSESERSGNNLLKNLKPILQDMNYFSYDNIWKIYEITDREWELSPASETTYGAYDASNNIINNYEYGSLKNPKNDPYVKTLYRNKDENGVTVSEGRIKEWGSHASDGTNREHIWCQSRGFKASSGASGPAGTDLHHLRSGDGYINQSLHNDNPYGYVDKNNIEKDGSEKSTFLSGNYLGKAKNSSSNDEADIVFEPQDSDKGDIARAIFYMAACYNNLSGNEIITEFNPNLTIVDYIYDAKSAISSDENTPATMAKLSDLLEWHKLDPVDEFEIYRNDLIFNNYQHNRNPFIDFPSWVDVVWGNESIVASPNSDVLHGLALNVNKTSVNIDTNKQTTFTLKASTADGSDITWIIVDSNIISASKNISSSKEEITFNVLKEGETTIIAKASVNGTEYSVDISVNVTRGFVIETWMIVIGLIIVFIFCIILAISKKARKKVKKNLKKRYKK